MAIWDRFNFVRRERVRPMQEQGVPGYSHFGGRVIRQEKSPKLVGPRRYQTMTEILVNTSIVAAGTRYFLNLLSKPTWTIEPAEDLGEGNSSDAAKQIAEFVEECMYDTNTSWSRIVKRAGLFKFQGFSAQEWTAGRTEEGLVKFKFVNVRPQVTIERWDIDPHGEVMGLIQTSPQTGQEMYLPRKKLIYLVDDTFTDLPDGLGIFRHLVEPAERLQTYLRFEGMGIQRDMRGIPVGRAPYRELEKLVKSGAITAAQAKEYTQAIEEFVRMQSKGEESSITLDSRVYENKMDAGISQASAQWYGLELLQGPSPGLDDLNKAIVRLNEEMARILGTEHLMIGGSGGSRALSEDKSRNLYLQVTSTLGDVTEAMESDFIDPLMWLNGWPDELKPSMKVEQLQFLEFQEIASSLRDMATAGAVLAPDDPVINDLRDLMGVSRMPDPLEVSQMTEL